MEEARRKRSVPIFHKGNPCTVWNMVW